MAGLSVHDAVASVLASFETATNLAFSNRSGATRRADELEENTPDGIIPQPRAFSCNYRPHETDDNDDDV